MRKLNTSEFIKRAILVHGNKYDYSKVKYNLSSEKICIVCPIHGEFWQLPSDHLRGHGCKKCANTCALGINDMQGQCNDISYKIWKGIIGWCYLYNNRLKDKSYQDCEVCEEWLQFSNFYNWFYNPENGYKDGYNIDKDILVKGNKLYSPQTCCFVPHEINKTFIKCKGRRGELPIGVDKTKNNMYRAKYSNKETVLTIGLYKTPLEAFNAYKIAKEQYIKELAEKYFQEGKITKKVYDALFRYEVEITD